ncbi:MAG TPA: hypothetical protein VMX54_04540 [Vicinamibacteria bacterium]|nr:hypothetical protein [Vicinamibacteria bacterium]
MSILLRLILTIITFVAGFYFTLWVPFSMILPNRPSNWVPVVGSAVTGVAVATFVWRRSELIPQGLASSTILGGILVGGVCFVAGFFGPMIFAPQANQGPLLGLFITGPLGGMVGCVGGAVLWLAKRRSR